MGRVARIKHQEIDAQIVAGLSPDKRPQTSGQSSDCSSPPDSRPDSQAI